VNSPPSTCPRHSARRLRSPGSALDRVQVFPTARSLERGIAALSELKLRNRIAKLEAATVLVEQSEQIVAENLRAEWNWDGRIEHRLGKRDTDVSGDRAVRILDRTLKAASNFEYAWEGQGRRPESLRRTSWEYAGKQVAQDLGTLVEVREFLQAARTLLAERLLAPR
jgi:hypothetical protein